MGIDDAVTDEMRSRSIQDEYSFLGRERQILNLSGVLLQKNRSIRHKCTRCGNNFVGEKLNDTYYVYCKTIGCVASKTDITNEMRGRMSRNPPKDSEEEEKNLEKVAFELVREKSISTKCVRCGNSFVGSASGNGYEIYCKTIACLYEVLRGL